MPFPVQWIVSQLFSYHPAWWAAMIAIVAGAAYLGRWRGIIVGHFIVALLIAFLDMAYQSQHKREMDWDIVFEIGVMGRILLINAVLFPISAVSLFAVARRRKPSQPAAPRPCHDQT